MSQLVRAVIVEGEAPESEDEDIILQTRTAYNRYRLAPSIRGAWKKFNWSRLYFKRSS